ncbi:MAG: FAD-binding protein, partial [Bauldia litoralis]
METLTDGAIHGLREALSGIAMAEDPATLRLKSRDFFWFSPILKPLLEGREAALVAMPRTRDEVIRIAAAAARHRVPVTVRG